MKIYGIELHVSGRDVSLDVDDLRSKAMSYFIKDNIIDAISTSEVKISSPCCEVHPSWDVLFEFKEAVVVDDI